jgi:hypothetical protein
MDQDTRKIIPKKDMALQLLFCGAPIFYLPKPIGQIENYRNHIGKSNADED